MQPKLIRTPQGHYVPVEWGGTNESCIEPFGERVLVLPDPFSPKSAGGLLDFPEDLVERMSEAAETGILIAIGDAAWTRNADRTGTFVGKRPEIGQRIIFERYAGSYQFGADGKRYRIMDDRCVGGVIVEPAKKPALTRVARPPLIAAR
jgi:co-chaperonin GroES (HSP10)